MALSIMEKILVSGLAIYGCIAIFGIYADMVRAQPLKIKILIFILLAIIPIDVIFIIFKMFSAVPAVPDVHILI